MRGDDCVGTYVDVITDNDTPDNSCAATDLDSVAQNRGLVNRLGLAAPKVTFGMIMQSSPIWDAPITIPPWCH